MRKTRSSCNSFSPTASRHGARNAANAAARRPRAPGSKCLSGARHLTDGPSSRYPLPQDLAVPELASRLALVVETVLSIGTEGERRQQRMLESHMRPTHHFVKITSATRHRDTLAPHSSSTYCKVQRTTFLGSQLWLLCVCKFCLLVTRVQPPQHDECKATRENSATSCCCECERGEGKSATSVVGGGGEDTMRGQQVSTDTRTTVWQAEHPVFCWARSNTQQLVSL
jgi:hypothetical protein